jgi:hypothetical protein
MLKTSNEGRTDMSNTRQMIPIAGLLGTIALAVYMVARLHAQATVPAVDFTNAASAEVQDAQGQILLRGEFAAADEDDEDEVERKASLQPAGTDTDAAGEVEVEFAKIAPVEQEIEFSVRNLSHGAPVRFFIDGHLIGQASVDRRGRAKLDVDVPVPGAAVSP